MPSRFPPSDNEVDALLSAFGRARIAVLGDFFLDRYLILDPALSEPSLETGLPAHQVVAIRNSPGAAGTVVNNLVALGTGTIHALGVIGDDAYGYELRRELSRRGVVTDRLIAASERFTPTYTKPLVREATGEREIERIDVINRSPTPPDLQEQIIEHVRQLAGAVDAVIILDQVAVPEHGVVTEKVRHQLRDLAENHPSTVFFADSRAQIGKFVGVMIKPNVHEALAAAGLPDSESPAEADVVRATGELYRRTGQAVFATRGAEGILLTSDAGQIAVPGIAVDGPVDITGAGDSATAGIVLSLCAGAEPATAAFMGNLVASITVQKLNTTGTASPEEVRKQSASLQQQDRLRYPRT